MESRNIMEKTLGLNIQTIKLQKYIFLGNIKYIQNIKMCILVWGLKQGHPIFNILLIKINFKYFIHVTSIEAVLNIEIKQDSKQLIDFFFFFAFACINNNCTPEVLNLQ